MIGLTSGDHLVWRHRAGPLIRLSIATVDGVEQCPVPVFGLKKILSVEQRGGKLVNRLLITFNEVLVVRLGSG